MSTKHEYQEASKALLRAQREISQAKDCLDSYVDAREIHELDKVQKRLGESMWYCHRLGRGEWHFKTAHYQVVNLVKTLWKYNDEAVLSITGAPYGSTVKMCREFDGIEELHDAIKWINVLDMTLNVVVMEN